MVEVADATLERDRTTKYRLYERGERMMNADCASVELDRSKVVSPPWSTVCVGTVLLLGALSMDGAGLKTKGSELFFTE
jgi:hypothetical protein